MMDCINEMEYYNTVRLRKHEVSAQITQPLLYHYVATYVHVSD